MRCLTVLVAMALAAGCQVLAGDPAPPLVHIRSNGAEISDVAEGSGETLIFMHGPALDWRSGEGLRALLAPRYRFVAYSRRHHSPNAWPDDGVGHFWYIDRPRDGAGIILRFIARHPV